MRFGLLPLLLTAPSVTQAGEVLECPPSWEELGFHEESFGWAVATHADEAVVTFANDFSPIVYRRGAAGDWAGTGVLGAGSAPSTQPRTAAMEDAVAAIGDPGDSTLLSTHGAVGVWERIGDVWTSAGTLLPATPAVHMRFGAEIAIDPSGSRIAVGATNQGGHGAVHLFEKMAGSWVFETELAPAGLADDAGFGSALALVGEWLFIGAPAVDWQNPGPGEVHVYREVGGAWLPSDVLESDSTEPTNYFGNALAFDGNELFVGDALRPAPDGSGHVSVFTFDGSDWVAAAPLPAPDGTEGFGSQLDVAGDRLAVAAAGRLFEFENAGSSWNVRYLIEDETDVFSNQLRSIALSPEGLVASAPYYDPNGFEYPDDIGRVAWFDGRDAGQALVACGHEASLTNFLSSSETLALDVPNHANGAYWVLGSATGTGPVALGFGDLPLTPDAYLQFTLLSPVSPVLPAGLGVLDADGRASTPFVVPTGLPPSLAGLELHHAALLASSPGVALDGVTNAVTIELVP